MQKGNVQCTQSNGQRFMLSNVTCLQYPQCPSLSLDIRLVTANELLEFE